MVVVAEAVLMMMMTWKGIWKMSGLVKQLSFFRVLQRRGLVIKVWSCDGGGKGERYDEEGKKREGGERIWSSDSESVRPFLVCLDGRSRVGCGDTSLVDLLDGEGTNSF